MLCGEREESGVIFCVGRGRYRVLYSVLRGERGV